MPPEKVFTYQTPIGITTDEFRKYTHFQDNILRKIFIAASKASFEFWAEEFSKNPSCWVALEESMHIYQHAAKNMKVLDK